MSEFISTEKNKVKIDVFNTYIATIEKSIGASFFQNLYTKINGEEEDILKDGKRSCARFASAILLIAGLINKMHATVEGTVSDMQQSGWYNIQEPKKGSVIVWEPGPESEGHPHIGFYISNGEAISNSTKERVPTRHHWTYGTDEDGNPNRKIAGMWWHEKLDS